MQAHGGIPPEKELEKNWKAPTPKLTHGHPIAGAAVVDDRFYHRRAACLQTAWPVVWATVGKQPACQGDSLCFWAEIC
jgi:hypothetical protein